MTAAALSPIAYVLCELKSRDFESGLLIAEHLLGLGYPVVLGQPSAIGFNLIHHAPKGVVLFRTANEVRAKQMAKVSAAGHVVVAMDEEALPITDETALSNVSANTFASAETFLAQSESHAAMIAGAFPQARLKVVGSARVELLRRQASATKSGDYVLFNTSFALTNSVWGDEQKAVAMMVRAQPLPADEVKVRLLFERASMEHMVALIRWLAPQHPVVVRPHPAEKAENWSGFPGVRVITGSSPAAWIAGAVVTVHSNSTTGLEAAVLDRTCLNVAPKGFEAFTGRFVMKDANYTVTSAQEAVMPLSVYLKDRTGPLAAWRPKISFLPDGARRIAEAIAEILPPPAVIPTLSWHSYGATDIEKGKFTATASEIAMPAQTLDESVFLLTPTVQSAA